MFGYLSVLLCWCVGGKLYLWEREGNLDGRRRRFGFQERNTTVGIHQELRDQSQNVVWLSTKIVSTKDRAVKFENAAWLLTKQLQGKN